MRSTFQSQELYNYSKQGNLIGQLIDEVIHEDCYEMRDFFKSNDKQIDYIIDIGANIGIFTLLSSVLFPKAKKILIEPNINNVDLLMDNLYGFNNAVVYNVALGDGGKCKMQFDQRWSGSDKTINNVDGDINSLTIAEIISLANGGNYIIKIDCEGAEKFLLTADKSLFDKCQYFVCEFHEGPDNNLKEFDKWVYNTFNEKYDIKIPNWGHVDVLNPNNAIINYIIKLK